MSVSYARDLSSYSYRGTVGSVERFDSEESLIRNGKRLAKWLLASQHCVIHCGAGISTSAGIPDFRGSNGVWTREQRGERIDISESENFNTSIPTFTHRAIVALIKKGLVKHVISQNVDGLFIRTNINRENISELHGNYFIDECSNCLSRFIRSRPSPLIGGQETGDSCPFCHMAVIDTVLNWEQKLPTLELETANIHSMKSDLALCLGTSLQMEPAENLPLMVKRQPNNKLVIVNLQETKFNQHADLIIHHYVDRVMRILCETLNIQVEEYNPELDPIKAGCDLKPWNRESFFNETFLALSNYHARGLLKYSFNILYNTNEHIGSNDSVKRSVMMLANEIKKSKFCIFYCGAGISTDASIPDFRGPDGVWTLKRNGGEVDFTRIKKFDDAIPTFTHRAIIALINKGLIHHVTSTNVDGLFLRANINRRKISEVHGNFFVDKCSKCNEFFIRNRPSPTMCCQLTGDRCPKCRSALSDSVLDWNGNLHQGIWRKAELASRQCDLAVCIGTSFLARHVNSLILQVKKASKKRHGRKLVIINIQDTEFDNRADILIKQRSDIAMRLLCNLLSIQVDPYDPESDPTKCLPDISPWKEEN